jgi:hypothetical protein
MEKPTTQTPKAMPDFIPLSTDTLPPESPNGHPPHPEPNNPHPSPFTPNPSPGTQHPAPLFRSNFLFPLPSKKPFRVYILHPSSSNAP